MLVRNSINVKACGFFFCFFTVDTLGVEYMSTIVYEDRFAFGTQGACVSSRDLIRLYIGSHTF